MIALIEQTLIAGIGIGAVYALIAYGVSMTWAVSRTLNFAHGDILMVGVFVSLACIAFGIPGPIAVAIAVAVGVALGIAVNTVVFRPLRDRGGTYAWLLGVVIVAAIIRSVGIAMFESRSYPAPFEFGSSGTVQLPGGGVLRASYVWLLLVAIALAAILQIVMNKTSFGRAVRAVAHSHDVAEQLGISSGRIRTVTFALSAGVATLAGTLVAPITFVSVGLGWMFTLKAFTAAVVGGIGDGKGALVGGIALGLLEQTLASAEFLVPDEIRPLFAAGLRDAAVFVVLIAFLVVRPRGIFGSVPSRGAR